VAEVGVSARARICSSSSVRVLGVTVSGRMRACGEDLERRAQLSHFLEVALGEVGSLQLLLAEFGQRVQAATEQCSHLLGAHQVASGQAADADQAGTDPNPKVIHRVRCSTTPAPYDLSRSHPARRPAESGSHTRPRP
jgi:hypothetical protein